MRDGRLVHIDFGFMLTSAPGRGLKFENAPFKLTAEFIKVLGGNQTTLFKRFVDNMAKGFLALNHESAKIILLVKMVANS